MRKIIYKLLVALLWAAQTVARIGWPHATRGILLDAEGDSGYWKARKANWGVVLADAGDYQP